MLKHMFAFSRVRSLEGLKLISWNPTKIRARLEAILFYYPNYTSSSSSGGGGGAPRKMPSYLSDGF